MGDELPKEIVDEMDDMRTEIQWLRELVKEAEWAADECPWCDGSSHDPKCSAFVSTGIVRAWADRVVE